MQPKRILLLHKVSVNCNVNLLPKGTKNLFIFGHIMVDAASHTSSHAFGEIVWLLSQSPLYKHFKISDLE
jgi:hypothetical protein